MLEVADLQKYYGTFHALKGISFGVQAGEVIGFLGPNGAGKTTTMKIITGFISMTSGSVKVDGFDVTLDAMEVQRRIGYLPENTPLYEDHTVLEYLGFIADVRGLKGARRKSRIDHVIEVCGLVRKRRAVIKTLSKGFRQRVGLAQAIIHEPKLVILDEPTVGLDPNQVFEAREIIRQIGENNTVILSSHILSEVEAMCRRVIIVNDGVIVAAGTPNELEAANLDVATLDVVLRGVNEDAVQVLKALPSVRVIRIGNRVEPACEFRIVPANRDAFIADLNRTCRERGWVIDTISAEPPKLEDVFRKLTGSKSDRVITDSSLAVATTASQVVIADSNAKGDEQ